MLTVQNIFFETYLIWYVKFNLCKTKDKILIAKTLIILLLDDIVN